MNVRLMIKYLNGYIKKKILFQCSKLIVHLIMILNSPIKWD